MALVSSMAYKIAARTTYEPARTLEPIYTGGEVASDDSGRWLATCVDDDVLVVDLETIQPRVRIEGDGELVTSLSLSPLGDCLVVCSRSLSMRIYSIEIPEGSEPGVAIPRRVLKPHPSPVVSTCIDETGTLLATGGADSTIKVWNIRGGFTTHTFHGHSGVISSLCFFKSGTLEPRKHSKRRPQALNGHQTTGAANDANIHLASGGEDGNVRIWNLNQKKSVASLDSHQAVVRSLAFSAEQQLLLSVGRDQTLILWDLRSFGIRRAIPTRETIEAAGFTKNSLYCFAGGENGVVRVWNTETGKEITQAEPSGRETDAIVSIASSSTTDRLIAIHQDQTLRVHTTKELENLPTGSTFLGLPLTKRISGNHDEIIDMACFGPDRSLLALATNTESIRIISTVDQQNQLVSAFGSDIALLEGHKDIIICLAVDWSGCWLATGSKDNTARLWHLNEESSDFTCVAVLQGHAESLGAVALPRAPPKTSLALAKEQPPLYLLTGSQDRTIKRWDTSKIATSSGEVPSSNVRAVYTRVAHEKDINVIEVSSSSSLFASASQDRTIKIWSLDDGSVAGILRGHKRGVWSINFSPPSASPLNLADAGSSSSRGLLVSGSGDHTVKVWSLATFTCLLTFEGHSNSVLKVIWLSPKPSTREEEQHFSDKPNQIQPIIASASSDTLIKLWNPYAPPTSDHLLATLDNHTDRVWSLVSPNDSNDPLPPSSTPSTTFPQISLISGAADGRLTFWTDTTSQTLRVERDRAAKRIEQDQALQNHMISKNYREVIILALTLNHPARLLALFQDLLKLPHTDRDKSSITGKKEVDKVLANLSHSQLYLLLQRVRDWNTSARTAPVAQRILHIILKSYPSRTFEDMARSRRKLARETDEDADGDETAVSRKKGKGEQGVLELLRALEVYTERHYRRIEELMDESWILEYTLREMDEVAGSAAVANETVENGGKLLRDDGASEQLVKVNGTGDNGDVEMT